MSGKNNQSFNSHGFVSNPDPTNLDLHVEQSRQRMILEKLSEAVQDIKEVLVGEDKRSGLVMDVDRLHRSHRSFKAILWVVFTTTMSLAGTAIYAYATK